MTTNTPAIFTDPENGFTLRTVELDDTTWFVAADVCRALSITNVSDVLTRLDGADIGSTDVRNTRGEMRPTRVVNESGLYDLVFESRKPAARTFRRWVTSEVLPAIARTGTYSVATGVTTDAELLASANLALRYSTEAHDLKDQLIAALHQANRSWQAALASERRVTDAKDDTIRVLQQLLPKRLRPKPTQYRQPSFFENTPEVIHTELDTARGLITNAKRKASDDE